jgi:polyisoprenoid-binding protein YceI
MQMSKIKFLPLAAGLAFGCISFLSVAAVVSAQQAAPALSSEIVLTIDATKSKTSWAVDSTLHTVHGEFAVKGGTLRIDPTTGRAAGEIVVYATSGESGNSSRDARMHKEILESAKYPDIIFHPAQFDGKLATSGSTEGNLRGTMSIHGTEHEIVVAVRANMTGDHWTSTAKFEVPYVEWGMKDASNFLLKVKPLVSLEADLSGAVETTK